MKKDTTNQAPIVCIVIDDDEDDQQLFTEAIREALGSPCEIYLYREAETAIAALGKENAQQPHVIFLDMVLPKIMGAEALVALRKIPTLEHIPIIICSTSKHPIQDEEAIRANATHQLVKPPSQKLLVEALKNMFEHKHDAFLIDPTGN